MSKYIQFKKRRELEEILSDTFKFIRLEYKPLLKALVRNAGLPFLVLLAAQVFWESRAFLETNVVLSIVFLGITSLLYYSFLFGTVLNYIKEYIAGQGEVEQEEVAAKVRTGLGSLVSLSALVFLMLVVGLMLCVLPGIYLYVPLSLTFALLIFQERNVGESIQGSFDLVKGEWWVTFATLLVVGILLALISAVFSLPAIIYALVQGFASGGITTPGELAASFDWVLVTLNVISAAVQYILYAITAIAIALIYFDLNEKKNQTGTLEQIETIGDH